MNQPKRELERASAWRTRGAVLIGAAILFIGQLIAFAGSSTLLVVDRLLRDGSVLALWLAAAAGFGGLVPLPKSQVTSSFRVVTALALGIGFLSLAQLGLGLAGQLHRATAMGVIVVGVALLLFRCRSSFKSIHLGNALLAPADWEWLWLLALPVLALAIVAAYVPPGVLWGNEPHGYDVLEYHLQVPREWYELHRITPLKHNVFSYFPMAMEMQYLLAMQLRGGAWAGMYLAQLMHVAVCGLSVLAVYASARQFAGKLPATLTAVAAANVPWIGLLGPVAYNEGGLLLFGTLAIGWALFSCPLSLRERVGVRVRVESDGVSRELARSDSAQHASLPHAHPHPSPLPEGEGIRVHYHALIVAGVFAGFACGVKLTAVPQVLLLVPLILAIVLLARREPITRVIASTAIFVIAGALVFSPWLVRNTLWTGNPVFPEAQKLLGSAHFTPAQTQRWYEANHLPGKMQRSAGGRIRAVGTQIIADWKFGYTLLPLGVLCAAVSIRRPIAWVLLGLLLSWLVFWIALTHLQGRFFVLAIPAAAMGIALVQCRWKLAAVGVIVAIEIAIGLSFLVSTFADKVGMFRDQQLLALDDFKPLLPEDVGTVMSAGDQPIALVGDARAFLYQLPTTRLRYRTVFDVNVKPNESIVEAWLGDQTGSPAIVVDPLELERFSNSYYGIPPLPGDFPGPRDHAFILVPPAH